MNWSRSRIFWGTVLLVVLAIVAVFLSRRSGLKHPQRIVVILPSPSNPYWIEVRRGVDHASAELGDRYLVESQSSLDMDATSQVGLLNGYLSRNAVDALVLGPASDSETVATVSKYSALNIPIVLIDTELNAKEVALNQVKISAFIGSDNIDGGHKAAST